MSKTVKVKAGKMIFLAETDESIEIPCMESLPGVPEGMQTTVSTEKVIQELSSVKNLIIACSDELLEAINSITPKSEKVTIEFGIKLGGEWGFPMLAKASSGANFKISIEWKKGES